MYIIFLAKSNEIHREQEVRARFATELIREVDPIFERKLVRDKYRKSSKARSWIPLVKVGDSDILSEYISNELLDMTGFYYACEAMICDPRDTILLTPEHVKLAVTSIMIGLSTVSGYGWKIRRFLI